MISGTSRAEFIRSNTTKCFPGTMPLLKSYPDHVAQDGYLATICLGLLRKWIVCTRIHFVSTWILRRNFNRFVTKQIEPLKQKPTHFLFVLNASKSGDGKVYLGSYQQPANHWTTCHVDTHALIVTYCDSLAWPSLVTLLKRIGKLIQATHNEEVSLYLFVFVYVHDPSSTGPHGHQCLSSCGHLYPLQRCGSICDVVVMVVAAIECLANDFFHQLTKKMDHTPVFYFS
jgi:hypothetical protein